MNLCKTRWICMNTFRIFRRPKKKPILLVHWPIHIVLLLLRTWEYSRQENKIKSNEKELIWHKAERKNRVMSGYGLAENGMNFQFWRQKKMASVVKSKKRSLVWGSIECLARLISCSWENQFLFCSLESSQQLWNYEKVRVKSIVF